MKINNIIPSTSVFTNKLISVNPSPENLFYMGSIPQNRAPSIAVVGTRKPTRYGTEVTERLVFDLAKYGIIIISGLALGVDSIAHRTALEANGTTLAVVVNTLPDISPRSNIPLAKQIINSGGAIVSEYGPGHDANIGKYSFLQRNRLVSGLADAVLITEASAKSGTLNTASHALTQGKEVFVVPGNITSPLSEGCNNLLKQGATPVTEARDIIEVVAPELLTTDKQTPLPLGDSPAESSILQLLATGIRDGEQLQASSGLSVADFSTALTMLEINGFIKPLGANQWTIK